MAFLVNGYWPQGDNHEFLLKEHISFQVQKHPTPFRGWDLALVQKILHAPMLNF
jgi:hypothetical protein